MKRHAVRSFVGGKIGIISAAILISAAAILIIYLLSFRNVVQYRALAESWTPSTPPSLPKLDTVAYDKKMLQLANNGTTTVQTASSTATSTPAKKPLWPVVAAYPKVGAILPKHRIIAFYGNFYSKGMGVLGEYSEAEVIQKLNAEVAKWNAADPSTPVMPAIEYIDVTAQELPGKQGLYSLRMPDSQIDKAIALAEKVNGIVILDIQLGLSTLQTELPLLEEYFKKPNVHLALDPEFAMKTGARPGTVIGSLDAVDINYAAQYLAGLVREHDLPPKILLIHRFTRPMVTNYKLIKPLPEVQMVVVMDGWGEPAKKINTYNSFISTEPIQFTGFKIFYKNDMRPPSTRLLTPSELLKLKPIPSFIQYQ